MRLLIASLLLTAAALAQELPFDRGSIGMMPGVDEMRGKLYGVFGRHQPRHAAAVRKVGALDKRLQNRGLPRAGRVKLQKERAAAVAARDKAIQDMRQACLDAGLAPEQLARLESIPRGALRRERYNHRVLLEVPGLTDAQRATIERLVAAADGAQLTLAEQQRLLVRGVDPKKEQTLHRRLTGACQQQIRAIEQRFWRMAYYVLTPAQMRASREIRSPRYLYVPETERQIYTLPGLTPAQANRIRALFREHESEAAADQALVRQLQAKMRARDVPQADRKEAQAQINAAYRRINELRTAQRDGIRAVLTPEQIAAFRALPPHVNLGIRGRGPWEILRDMRWHPEQRAALQKLGAEMRAKHQEVEKARREAMGEMAGAGLGPESPQSMTMQMMQMGARGESMALHRDTGHKIFVEICDPEQVAAWVAAPSVKP